MLASHLLSTRLPNESNTRYTEGARNLFFDTTSRIVNFDPHDRGGGYLTPSPPETRY